jgi:phosphoribosylaminoimidazolecarboxamide formyltransferase / IMP cyclohydrolase
VRQHHGKQISFNNVLDLDAARALVAEFDEPACAIVKHNNPCGVALGEGSLDAYRRAFECDPLSAFGGVIALNRAVDPATAEALSQQFIEVLFAPGYDDDALIALRLRQGTRILVDSERRRATAQQRGLKRVLGGMLVQDADAEIEDREGWSAVCGAPDEKQWGDLLFAWRVCKHVSSNAIVLAKNLATIGIGAGQMSRVDAVRIALEKAEEFGHDVAGAALASDAFFPFSDGPELALARGVRAIVQPGGSKRDDDVIAAAMRANATMVFTGRRHFRH